jgi:hypothetical protein
MKQQKRRYDLTAESIQLKLTPTIFDPRRSRRSRQALGLFHLPAWWGLGHDFEKDNA